MSSPPAGNPLTDRSRLERIFLLCADLPPGDWAPILDRECADDSALRTRVRRLLETERSDVNWESPVWNIKPLHFGRYRVTRRIGAGGMGVVYEAVRDDAEFDKKVAIKAIPPGLITERGIRLLRQERQILAHLEHPNIARLLDGGTSDEGVPFLVMELVEGLPLLEYARDHWLNEAARLRIMLEILEGIACAHRNLIIHRDLKPANILVTADGTPKILDFGIARLLDRDSEVTLAAERALTLDYASPEQIHGNRMTTESDIYSLGLVLVVLLTGVVVGRGDAEGIARRSLRGDVASIAIKALHALPERRYRSVEQFGQDIRNYLDGRPVKARPQTFFYRTNRFVRRNRFTVAAGFVALSAIAVGLLVRLEALRRAERRFNDIRKLADSLVYELPETMESVPGTLEARRLIGNRAVEYLDGLARESDGETSLNSDLAAAYAKVGPLAFDVRKETEIDRKAVSLLRSVVAAEPQNLKYRQQFGEALDLLANCYRRTGQYDVSRTYYLEYLHVDESLVQAAPQNREFQESLADAYVEVGQLFLELGRFDEAFALIVRSPPIVEHLLASDPASPHLLFVQNVNLSFLARSLAERGDLTSALDRVREASVIAAQLLVADPANRAYIRTGWSMNLNRGRLETALGEFDSAVRDVREGLPAIEALSHADPADTGYRRGIAVTCVALADALASQGRPAEAAQLYARAISYSEHLFAGDPKHVETTIDLLDMYAKSANLQLRRKSVAAAEVSLARALQLIELRKPLPAQFFLESNIATVYRTEGNLARARRDGTAAVFWYRKSLDAWRGLRLSGRWSPKYNTEEQTTLQLLRDVGGHE